jgi:hypothetical protein
LVLLDRRVQIPETEPLVEILGLMGHLSRHLRLAQKVVGLVFITVPEELEDHLRLELEP